MKNVRIFLFLAIAILSGSGSGQASETTNQGITESLIDRTVNPCDNFYQFACGKWITKTQIPADRPAWSRGFVSIEEANKEVLHQILETYSAGNANSNDADSKKLGDFYASCMDERLAEKNSFKDLKSELAKIDEIQSPASLIPTIARLHLEGAFVFFAVGAIKDMHDPTQMIAAVDQAGLGMPDRDYYLSEDPKMVKLREQYRKHIAVLLQLTGISKGQAEVQVRSIMNLETSLAKASLDRVERRDLNKLYHRLERKGLKELAPNIDWDVYFRELGHSDVQAIDVRVPGFFSALNELLRRTSLADLKSYLRFHVIDNLAPALSKKFVNENFNFYGKSLMGQKALESRWKRCVNATDSYLGFALGKAFVEKSFGEDGKATSREMIENIEKAFEATLKKLDWMDEPTKTEGLRKLNKIANKIGYPDKWRDYSSLTLIRTSYVQNRLAAERFLHHFFMNKIGKPVDRTEWEMSPSTVNAYYNLQFNEMVFPAGILQPPFFYRNGSHASNYGAIGLIMGHELTHGFDDQGKRFNADGSMVNWWSSTAAQEFEKRALCLVGQFGNYTVGGNLHVNGKLTLGENIGDQGGIKLAYQAWRNSQSSEKTNTTPSGGFSMEQQFFISYAQAWCMKAQPEFERMLIQVDVHSPDPVRVNGTVSNFPEFQAAFSCKSGSKMAPKDRCAVW